MNWLTTVLAQGSDILDQLPPEVVDRLPPDVVEKLRDGVIDKIPENIVDQLPANLQDRVPTGLIEFASANPLLTLILVVVGLLGIAGFVYGVMKSAFKVALFWAVVGAGSWFWFFNR